uniref:F-box domain-containing protein n=1 Tax=Steinernema glaseri TaxID=37863 RepID=A0A1I7ZTU0_9BILA
MDRLPLYFIEEVVSYLSDVDARSCSALTSYWGSRAATHSRLVRIRLSFVIPEGPYAGDSVYCSLNYRPFDFSAFEGKFTVYEVVATKTESIRSIGRNYAILDAEGIQKLAKILERSVRATSVVFDGRVPDSPQLQRILFSVASVNSITCLTGASAPVALIERSIAKGTLEILKLNNVATGNVDLLKALTQLSALIRLKEVCLNVARNHEENPMVFLKAVMNGWMENPLQEGRLRIYHSRGLDTKDALEKLGLKKENDKIEYEGRLLHVKEIVSRKFYFMVKLDMGNAKP